MKTKGHALYEYSTCIPIGGDPVGWTFKNYTVPEGLFGEILTSDDMGINFLWGTPLTATDGRAWLDVQSQTAVEWAVYQLEKKLNIDIYPRQYYTDDDENSAIEESKFVIKEMAYPNRRRRRFLIVSRHRPIQEITRFDFFSPVDTKILNLLPWMRLDKRNGSIWYYPKQGALDTFAGFGWPWNYILDGINYPDLGELTSPNNQGSPIATDGPISFRVMNARYNRIQDSGFSIYGMMCPV